MCVYICGSPAKINWIFFFCRATRTSLKTAEVTAVGLPLACLRSSMTGVHTAVVKL